MPISKLNLFVAVVVAILAAQTAVETARTKMIAPPQDTRQPIGRANNYRRDSFLDESALSHQIDGLYRFLSNRAKYQWIEPRRQQKRLDSDSDSSSISVRKTRKPRVIMTTAKPNCTGAGTRTFHVILGAFTWNQASAACTAHPGWILANVFVQSDQDSVVAAIHSATADSGRGLCGGFWNGGKTANCNAAILSANFKWGNTSYFVTDFINKWDTGNSQPNCGACSLGNFAGTVGCMRFAYNGLWSDGNCGETLEGALCEDTSGCTL